MKANMQTTTPFSLKNQYLPEIRAARNQSAAPCEPAPVAAADRDVAEVQEAPATKQTWDYAEVRKAYIKACREGTDLDYAAAKTAWDASKEKREYLGRVSVSELKRRKFLPKGAQENPWA